MLSKRAGSVVVLAMLLGLVGCPPKPAPAPVTVVALVAPGYSPTTGYAVVQFAQPGQILEWRTLVGTPKDYWIQYPDGANPCTETSPIHGTQDKPAQCHVRSDLAGQPLPYTYSISDVDPTQIIKPLGVTPCNGCSYAIGTPTGLATSVDKGPTPGPVPPPGPAKAFVSVPGLIYLSCAANTKTFVADPGSAKTGDVQSVTWYPEAPAPPTDWLVTFKPPTGSQQPLCAGNPNPTQFTSASPGCNLNLPRASGTYTYSVSSPSSACAESDGNTITIGP